MKGENRQRKIQKDSKKKNIELIVKKDSRPRVEKRKKKTEE